MDDKIGNNDQLTYDDEREHYQVEAYDTIQRLNLFARDFQLGPMVAAHCLRFRKRFSLFQSIDLR